MQPLLSANNAGISAGKGRARAGGVLIASEAWRLERRPDYFLEDSRQRKGGGHSDEGYIQRKTYLRLRSLIL
jgi:hypothetical protein